MPRNDSLMTIAKEFPRSVENQLLQLVYILAKCLSCAATRGVNDCGLVAIAWAYHLLVGDHPNTLTLWCSSLRVLGRKHPNKN